MILRRRTAINLLLTAVIAVFIVSLLFSIRNLEIQHRADRDAYGHVIWIVTQLERDYLKLLTAIDNHAHEANPASRRELDRRIGALHSRLQLFREGSQGAILTTIPEVRDMVAALGYLLTKHDAALMALAEGDMASALRLMESFRAPERAIHRAVIAAFHKDNAYADSLNKDFDRFVLLSAISLLIVLISGGALVLLLILQARRARRAELHSAQARREAEQACARAESASRAKSDFLAQMSHELRTPLNAILGFSEVVKRQLYGPVGDRRYSDYAAHIHSSGNHLLSLIDDILDLSRVEAGKYELQAEPVALAELVESELSFLTDYAEGEKISLRAELSDPATSLVADRRALRQILLNLLSNAIKYTPPGSDVLIATRPLTDGGLALSVSDNGDGIAPENIAKVLEPFGRLHDPLTQRHEGCGLGLSITKRLVELHDGRLTIAPRPGGGTVVTVELPAERVHWAAAAA